MPPRCPSSTGILLPFLYPSLFRTAPRKSLQLSIPHRAALTILHSTSADTPSPGSTSTDTSPSESSSSLPASRLNPPPDDYAQSTFADKARVTVHAGSGGHGCISFLREAYLAEGPANGGDGGHGGNVYIQAVHGETSLHKLARRRVLRAGRGKTGQGSARGGSRGDDMVIQVPVGTVVREIGRIDPVVEERLHFKAAREKEREYERLVREVEAKNAELEDVEGAIRAEMPEMPERPHLNKFILYPGISETEKRAILLPRLPRRERLFVQPDGPIHLDLSTPTPRPILIAAGGIGGLGNPHFVSKERPRPLFATKGERAVTMQLELELKLLADVGLVGLPNAGKSTLLRSLTNSRARVGNWAFTTLQPNIGTVVLDNHKGRPIPVPKPSHPAPHSVIHDAQYGSVVLSRQPDHYSLHTPGPEPRTRFTVADIPGLIEGAHLDRGLGVAFLRHVERAGVLAFVIDLSAGDAVEALKALWTEVGLYARMREEEEKEREIGSRIDWEGDGSRSPMMNYGGQMIVADLPEADTSGEGGLHIAAKPWFVVATKGDLPGTQENYARLKEYLDAVTDRREPHPSMVEGAWISDCAAIPVSAIHGQGVDRIIHWTVGLLDGE
ncbi:GTP-binding protein Obg/CgtA [Annulohypoxylon maeteangense]|uniref:GTP-binding protein Obg/CgtA n=1 Tax=Annulohypoxylon maeteangense TaxID=1927788 RepID=UPI002007AB21|nr:GTP-binding protein Obg/CgtA [Annulohypoxylon maeteangense]KAI0888885.1 GTP-binding protein Obg/CgtA [Annulohypoxylon maeteangense]